MALERRDRRRWLGSWSATAGGRPDLIATTGGKLMPKLDEQLVEEPEAVAVQSPPSDYERNETPEHRAQIEQIRTWRYGFPSFSDSFATGESWLAVGLFIAIGCCAGLSILAGSGLFSWRTAIAGSLALLFIFTCIAVLVT